MVLDLYVMTDSLEIEVGVTDENCSGLGRTIVLHRRFLRAVVLKGDCSTRFGWAPNDGHRGVAQRVAVQLPQARCNRLPKYERSCARSGRLERLVEPQPMGRDLIRCGLTDTLRK